MTVYNKTQAAKVLGISVETLTGTKGKGKYLTEKLGTGYCLPKVI